MKESYYWGLQRSGMVYKGQPGQRGPTTGNTNFLSKVDKIAGDSVVGGRLRHRYPYDRHRRTPREVVTDRFSVTVGTHSEGVAPTSFKDATVRRSNVKT